MNVSLKNLNLKYYRTWVTGFMLMAGCYLYFRYVTPYHVCFKEQMLLFVFRSSYILSYFSKPASIACLGGDFLTQFFYFKSGGAAVITLLLALEWRLVYLTLNRFAKRSWLVVALLPVMVEWISFPHLSFAVSLSVSFILALATFLLYTKLNRKIAFITGLLLIPLLYMLAGASVFLFVFLITLYERKRKVSVLVAITCAIPFLFRNYYLLTLRQAYLYPYPDIMQALSPVTLAVLVLLFIIRTFAPKSSSGNHNDASQQVVRYPVIIITFIIVSLWIVALVKTTDRNRENLFGMMTEAYHNRWDIVLEIAKRAELKTPIAAHYVNIALSKKNLLGDRLMDFYQPFSSGLLLSVTPGTGWLDIFSSSDGFFHIGDMEMAQHAALVGMLSSPFQRSARLVERLAEINLINGDWPVASKYIRMLNATLFHRIDFVGGGSHCVVGGIGGTGVHKAIFRADVIRKSTDHKVSLELFVASNPDNMSAVNYLLCYHLLNKDIPAFFKAYTSYCKGTVHPVPKVYAQALLIYFAVMQSPLEEVMAYDINPDIIRQFSEYTRLYESVEGQLAPVQEQYPKSYWLYYHFAVTNNNINN